MEKLIQLTPSRTFLFIAILYLTLFLSHAIYLKKTVYGDGSYYFAWLRSVVVDHDINFTNDYQLLGISAPITQLRIPGNKYSIGPAFLWLPGYLWTHIFIGGTGIEWPYQLVVGLQSVGYTLIGCVLLYTVLRRYFPKSTSIIAILFLTLTTNLLFYGAIDVVNSHSPSFFTAALFLTLLSRKSKPWFLLGIVLGLSSIIRLQDVVIGLLIIPILNKRALIPLFLGFTLIFAWQILAWYSLYGAWLTSPYILGGEGFSWAHPQIIGVLFNAESGLFLWTPSIILCLIGIFHLPSPLSKNYKLFLTIFILQTYLIASWSTWWQGASFSGRMFVSLLPILTLGFAGFIHYLENKFSWSTHHSLILLFIFSFLNFSSIFLFLQRT